MNVVVQKSIGEGFGRVVTEAMWKAKPVSVIGGNVGGIRRQIVSGVTGILVDTPEGRPTRPETCSGITSSLVVWAVWRTNKSACSL
jgi:glycosyltransferase involved in cell wall biosynthesis